ncbi:RFTN2 protein, partial [Polypterus senegalus]
MRVTRAIGQVLPCSKSFASYNITGGKRPRGEAVRGPSLRFSAPLHNDCLKVGRCGFSTGLYLDCTIDGRPCSALMDTGSTICLLQKGVLPETAGLLPEDWTPTNSELRSVTGERTVMPGKKLLSVLVGTSQTSHEFWLADIKDKCIIGLDLLAHWGARVDVSRAVLCFGNETVPLWSGWNRPGRTARVDSPGHHCSLAPNHCLEVAENPQESIAGQTNSSHDPPSAETDSFDVAVADFAELRTDNPIPGRSPHVPLCCQRIHERPGPLAVMGCGLRKLEDPDDSSPGKIYSTLKRAQVETKSDAVYEYTLLDFSLEGSTNPEIIRISSLRDITCELEQHYRKGFVLATLHPVVLSVGRKRQLPLSLLYRAVLSRRRPSSKYAASAGPGTPRLLIEEWPLPGETLTSEVVSCLLDKVNICGQRGMRFLGFVPQQSKGTSQTCNGGVPSPKPSSRGSPNGQSSESGIEDDPLQENDTRLFALFHIWDTGYPAWTAPDEDHPRWTYHQGALSMKVTRKGQMISGLEADWLELTTSYYKKGWSLIDSFVYWETRKGEPVPRSLEGLFVYEEGRGCNEPTQGNDTIVVEQWTVIEGSEVKTDYGPLIHTLAEFGWLLTSVLPTPIIRHDSDGNLCTKQVVFLQRPVGGSSSEPRPLRQEKLASQSPHPEVSPHTVSRGVGGASRDVFGAGDGDFSSFGGYPNMLKDLEEVGYEQEEGASEVTCM